MALLDIRKQFIKFCGRYDLIVDDVDFKDNGADWFINAGQRLIERQLDVGRALATSPFTLRAGQWNKKFPNCRAVHEAVIENLTSHATVVLKKNIDILTKDISALTAGMPTEFFPAVERYAPQNNPSEIRVPTYEGRYLYFNCPADMDYGVTVTGLFYSPSLTDDGDETYWTEAHPDILVKAALYELEIFYRNAQGTKDFQNPLMLDIMDLDKDEVSQQISQINQMGG